VRPNDNIYFKEITIEEAYTACFTTDALVAAVTQLARGRTTLASAQRTLDSLVVSTGHGDGKYLQLA
jgi:hypothetical protein